MIPVERYIVLILNSTEANVINGQLNCLNFPHMIYLRKIPTKRFKNKF